ncbi:MAG: ATP-binding cassette domain-containing protein [Thermoplasmataceae archaeon]
MKFLECRKLTKRFGKVGIFNNLDLVVEDTRVLLVGANGLGKSTLIKILFGLQKPNEGSIKLLGMDSERDEGAIRKNVGYLSPEPSFPPYSTVKDLYDFASTFTHRNEVERLEEFLDVSDLRKRNVRFLSSGEKQLLSIILAFSQRKKTYLMDEAVSSIDPRRRMRVIELLSDFQGNLLITTHEMTEMVSVTDRMLRIFRRDGQSWSSFEEKDVLELPMLLSLKGKTKTNEIIQSLGSDLSRIGPLIKARRKIKETLNLIGEDIVFAKRDFDE